MPIPEAIRLATRAAALQVTRPGAADAIPTRAEAEAFEGDPSG
jgi:ribokinase